MDSVKNRTSYLFSRLDGDNVLPRGLRRKVLEKIIEIDPTCARAHALLDELNGIEYPGNPVERAIEKVEWLATQGSIGLAKEGARCIEQQWGDIPLAQAWLSSVHVLWDQPNS